MIGGGRNCIIGELADSKVSFTAHVAQVGIRPSKKRNMFSVPARFLLRGRLLFFHFFLCTLLLLLILLLLLLLLLFFFMKKVILNDLS